MLEACIAVAPYRNEEETAVTGRGDIIQLKKLTIEFRRTEANARRADGLLELRLEGSCGAPLGKQRRPERGYADRRRAADPHRSEERRVGKESVSTRR